MDSTDGRLDARNRIIDLLKVGARGAEELSLHAILQRLVRFACRRAGARYGVLDFGAAAGQGPNRFITAADAAGAGEGAVRPEDLVAGWENRGSGSAAAAGILRVPVGTRNAVYAHLYLTGMDAASGAGSQAEEAVRDLAGLTGAAIDNAWRRRHWLTLTMELPRRLPGRGNALQLIAGQALAAGQAELVLAVFPAAGSRLRCQAAAGTDHARFTGRDLPVPRGRAGDFPAADRPVIIAAPDWLKTSCRMSKRGLLVPLKIPGEQPGFLLLFRRAGGEDFSPVDLEMGAAFSEQATLAVELASAERIREAHTLSAERDRLAGELNDLVIQRLFAAGLGLQSLRRVTKGEEAHQRISALTSELDQAISELRDAVYALAPEPAGTEPLSRRILRNVHDGPYTACTTTSVELSGPLDTATGSPAAGHLLTLLRVALAHAAKGRETTDLRVTVALEERILRLGIETSAPGTGLTALAEQRETVPHTLQMTTSSGITRLEWAIPCMEDNAQDPGQG
jgi:two-component system, NarL family, sensor histidine kinase DevS